MIFETLLQNYIDIETKTFLKSDKNKKFEELFKGINDLREGYSIGQILEAIQKLEYQKIIIRQPFFREILYPILTQEIEKNNVDAMKALIKLDRQLEAYKGYSKDLRYSYSLLLEKALTLVPEDRELLTTKELSKRTYFYYTLHEIPTGVLFGADGASIEECDALLYEISEYEKICGKLQRNESDLIKECRYYYSNYKKYLAVYTNYQNFSDYLNKECEGQI